MMSGPDLTRRQLLSTGAAAAALGPALPANAGDKADATGSFRFCLNTSTIRGQKLPLDQEIELAAKAGFDSMEPWINEITAYKEAGGKLKDLKKRLEDHNMTIESAIGFAKWIVDDEALRKQGLEDAKRDMDLVAQIGGNAARTARVLSQQKLTSKKLDSPETANLARQVISLVSSDPSVRCAGLRLAGQQGNNLPVTRNTRALLCKRPLPPATSELITFPIRGSDLALELYIHDETVRQESLVRSLLVLTVSALAVLLSVISTVVSFRFIIGNRLRRLRGAMTRVRETGKRQSIDPGPQDEIGTLVGEYNNLVLAEAERAAKLEAAIEQEMLTQEKLAAANNELTHWIHTGQSERRFQDFASASSDFFWELDSERKFTYVSEHFAEITGVPAEVIRDLARRIGGATGACPVMYSGLEYSNTGIQAMASALARNQG